MDFNIGCNFDTNLPDELASLNQQFHHTGNRISSVYGSDQAHAWCSARPDFRLPELTEQELAMHVAEYRRHGIDFNYTFNTPTFGSKAKFIERQHDITEWVLALWEMGVARLIIADPMLLDFISRKIPEVTMKLELSTIMHVDTPMQLIAYKQLDSRIDRVVGNILYNRDFRKLKAFNRVCERYGMSYELMTNEFCSTISTEDGVVNLAHCIYRDSCYACHASNTTKKEALAERNYPMGKCMSGRAKSAADWLRSNFILPQHLRHYNEIGITNFKITGRTAKTPYLLEMAQCHLAERFDGNLLQLWKPLETIYSEKDELSGHKHKFNVPADKMGDFLNPWVNGQVDCTTDLCSDCRYCDMYYENVLRPVPDFAAGEMTITLDGE
jgi:collagenase-like PrtC family protease